jgi:hypothetical protein
VFCEFVFLVAVAAQAQALDQSRVPVCCTFRGWDAPATSISYSYINIKTRQLKPPLYLNSHTTNIHSTLLRRAYSSPSRTRNPVNKSLDSTQRHGVFGSVYGTNRTVGDTARHCDQGLLSFSLFPGSVCEHCLFLFCTLASCTYRPWHARE